jgi:nucleotide-binding universal stress UspA family protein
MIQLRKVLLPTDFSAPSRNAARYAASFAGEYGARVYLLHVMEGPSPPMMPEEMAPGDGNLREEVEKGVAEELKGALPENAEKGLEVVHLTRHGKPHEEIVGAARERDVDLIVLPTHGHGGFAHGLIGSTAERVVRKAPCPVLTVRAMEHEFVTT